MKSRISLLLFTILAIELIDISAMHSLQLVFTWHHIKKKVQENKDKLLWGIIGSFIVNHLYMQQVMCYRVINLQSMTEKLQNNIRMTNILLQRDNNIEKKVDDLHTLLDNTDVKQIIANIEQYVSNNEITINETSEKLLICWTHQEHDGNSSLYELGQLLLWCREKYQYPQIVETDFINNQLDCILLPYQGLNTRWKELLANLSHKKREVT